ncbi:DNA glycosylase AlkZ-like family protein [Gordonia sp. (in: high G+C Gram-positive bacteria)]|uniref:DNA glycosylase AlkZ-like family protein n=1 Tax=Gordonia sp. (in: high G+C Gram-positive bacteria) TaxID=84139 RepID=UPI0039E51D3A
MAGKNIWADFGPATRRWFTGAFGEPTAAQAGAWRSIASGDHTLVIAPTGSGKTLAAFLWAIDRMVSAPRPERKGVRVVYVSPLKALAVDVERNLSAPLVGIGHAAAALGLPAPEVTVGVRSGDTPAAARRALVSSPPDILITTPESLYLMLTSAARETLRTVETVIVDEIHALAPTKRGTHLALSLERLDLLTERPVQRIGLSATVRPPETVARFLVGAGSAASGPNVTDAGSAASGPSGSGAGSAASGPQDDAEAPAACTVVRPPAAKTFDLSVQVPVEDMTNLPVPEHDPTTGFGDRELDDAFSPTAGSLWPFVEAAIVDAIAENRSTIVFANSRRLAERLTARLNEIWAERLGLDADEFDPHRANPAVPGGMPAMITGAVATGGAPPILARAHHGSVSKDQRAEIEDTLKTGRLRCVVATSSLELGIDMGAVDLVIQVETPPSVASGLQRIGRAGHQVGEISRGLVFPKHRTDLIGCAVTVSRMLDGAIEQLTVPRNPLDILAQQTVAETAVADVDVDEWFDTVRRSAPYAALTRDVYDAVLDLISGRYPSDEFAGLAARVDYDRATGTLTARRGTLRTAVTSGGTIPDRGMFGVFLATGEAVERPSSAGGSGAADARGPRRVGELDEQMVYESRVGDVFALGASSWRIVEITHDRVLVIPAFGQPGRLPFWIGDAVGRPAELGAAMGRFVGAAGNPDEFDRLADETGLSPNARTNLRSLLDDQRASTGVLPTDRTLVVERFRDELGDWRLVLHSPYGLRVHAPWASAIATKLSETLGLDGVATAADDGIIVRLPDTDDAPPGAEVFDVDPDEIGDIALRALADSSLFAARFRECASRALLLPRRDPGRRAPLWQQRQRAAELLAVAAKFPDFPIILETARECLEDVYDLPALTGILSRIKNRRIRLAEVETPSPSPFAASMPLGYAGSFMYDDDAPLAERRATALTLDTSLLAQLLGRVDLRELLDPVVIADTVARLQRTAPERQARDGQDVADLLRWLGPLTGAQIAERYRGEEALDEVLAELAGLGRIVTVVLLGVERFASIDDVARLRDGLGTPTPLGVPAAYLESPADPVGDLIHRYARTHGPFTAGDVAAELGLGVAVVREVLVRLAGRRTVIEGEFVVREPGPGDDRGQWCHTDVLGRLRRGSLAAGRAESEPVDHGAYARFLLDWQHVAPDPLSSSTSEPSRPLSAVERSRTPSTIERNHAPSAVEQSRTPSAVERSRTPSMVERSRDPRLRGIHGLMSVIEQLAGQPVPASAWESLVLPSRVVDYRPAMLDELLAGGEVVWSGHGRIAGADGWIALHPADSAPLTLRPPDELEISGLHREMLSGLEAGALRYAQLAAGLDDGVDDEARHTALWDLVWAGRVTNDSFSPVRALLTPGRSRSGSSTPSHRVRGGGRAPRLRSARLSSRYLAGADASGGVPVPPLVGGRWALLERVEIDPTKSAAAMCEILLDRYGVVTKGPVVGEEVPGGFARIYRALSVFEDTGQVRRGYFVDGLGGAQFAAGHTVDTLREHAVASRGDALSAVVLAATDPANPYGAALTWPDPPPDTPRSRPAPGDAGVPTRSRPVPGDAGGPTRSIPEPGDAGGPTRSIPEPGDAGARVEGSRRQNTGHRPGRKPGALVVLVEGHATLFVERGGKRILTFSDDADRLEAAAAALATAVRRGRVPRIHVDLVDGDPVRSTELGGLLADRGFAATPRGLRMNYDPRHA